MGRALEIDGVESAYLYTNKADTDLSLRCLEQISHKDLHSEHAIIWDRAGFHPDETDEAIAENVTVLKEPAYSPELNSVEKLWDMLCSMRDSAIVLGRTWIIFSIKRPYGSRNLGKVHSE